MQPALCCLWSGCVSEAFQEEAFLAAFEQAGFYGIHLVKRDSAPWRVVEVEFRAVTVVAYKGKQGQCRDHGYAVIYPGPARPARTRPARTRRGFPVTRCEKPAIAPVDRWIKRPGISTPPASTTRIPVLTVD